MTSCGDTPKYLASLSVWREWIEIVSPVALKLSITSLSLYGESGLKSENHNNYIR